MLSGGDRTTYYATGIQYASHGAMSQMTYGSGLVETRSYNAALQPFSISVSGTSSLTLQYSYCSTISLADCGTNNGNVTFQSMGGPTQSYQYDTLNRLKRVDESGGSQVWHQLFSYDQYGNRAVVNDAGTFMPYMTRTPRVGALTDALPYAGNRWADSAVSYDGVGNLSANTGASESFTYDAENRLTQSITGAGTVTYGYDAEGRRAKKSGGAGVTYYVYGADGELVAESGSVTPEPCTRCFLTADHLGSTRMVTDGSGVKKGRLDYAPFGEEITRDFRSGDVGFPGSLYPQAAGVGPDVRFAGKERDAETGLDYFGARYYGGAQGRFTSPDTPFVDQTPDDPQSWNLYSYVRNNPLIFTDPTGNDCVYVNSGGNGIDSVNNQNTSKQCGKSGGYWVDGTVTDARFAHGSLILNGTTDGTNRTSASYGLSPTFGDQLINEMGRRQDASNRVIAIAATPYVALATSYAAVYALPELLVGLSSSEVGAIGGSITVGIKLGGKFLKINPNVPLRALLKGARLAKGDGFPEHLLDLTGKQLQDALRNGQVTPQQVQKIAKVVEQGARLMEKTGGKQ